MKNALILHGTDATPKSNWFVWLKNELEQQGYSVWLPQLPGADKPNTHIYNEFLLANSDFVFNDKTILIGHSSGAVEILSLLQHLPEDITVKAVFLVSAFKDSLGWESLQDLFIDELNFEAIKTRTQRLVLVHSDNDPYVPIEHARYLQKQLDSELVVVPGQGHFNTELSPQYKQFPKLLELIKEQS
jgi:predicted alpha/beta hydrolase family esterase